MLSFEITATDGPARNGRLATPHGVVETPAFMPVGTLGAVKGVPPDTLESLGAQVMLSNLYHLTLRPGIGLIEELGGLHAFTSWPGPILTDSGGYQVFSLASRREIDDDGVSFRSHLDGQSLRFTPEGVVDRQRRLGVDVAMVLDECTPWPVSEEEAAASLERTGRWARRCRDEWERRPVGRGAGGLFGIVQGSGFRALRERAAVELVELDFDGYAIGGVSVGEPGPLRRRAVEWTAPLLPTDRPRYLMGMGTPADILHAVRQGVDLFDCVLPARNARHGNLFTRGGVVKLKNARYRDDPLPPDPACGCPTCRRVSRALLAHLIRSREITGMVLATIHNLSFYLDFMAEIRQATASGALAALSDPVTPEPPTDDPVEARQS
ncbi:MAG: tRNA guanosine(34) transglycosylase Tgt [Acidobacteriota bacterium]